MLAVLTSSKPGLPYPSPDQKVRTLKSFAAFRTGCTEETVLVMLLFCSFVVWHWKHKKLKEKEKTGKRNLCCCWRNVNRKSTEEKTLEKYNVCQILSALFEYMTPRCTFKYYIDEVFLKLFSKTRTVVATALKAYAQFFFGLLKRENLSTCTLLDSIHWTLSISDNVSKSLGA